LEWVYGVWKDGDVGHYQPFKALHDYRCEHHRAVVIGMKTSWEQELLVILKHGDYRLGQGEVEND
jgi:hypothetical protein